MRLFNANPFAVAFKRSEARRFRGARRDRRLLRITLDARAADHQSARQCGGSRQHRPHRAEGPGRDRHARPDYTIGGMNPRGVVLNSTDTRAYVMDFPLARRCRRRCHRQPSRPLQDARAHPFGGSARAGSVDATVQRGKVLFNSAIGPAGDGGQLAPPAGRLSDSGWGACYSCHRERPDRQRHVDVCGWTAPGDLDGKHLHLARCRHPERLPAAARFASAGAQLVGRPRRGAGLHAQHPSGVGRRRPGPGCHGCVPEGAAGLGPASRSASDRQHRAERRPGRDRDLYRTRSACADLAAERNSLASRRAAGSSRPQAARTATAARTGRPASWISSRPWPPRSSMPSSSGSCAASAPSIPACSPTESATRSARTMRPMCRLGESSGSTCPPCSRSLRARPICTAARRPRSMPCSRT